MSVDNTLIISNLYNNVGYEISTFEVLKKLSVATYVIIFAKRSTDTQKE